MMNILITLLIMLIVFGIIWYVVTLLPIVEPFKSIALAIVGLILVVYLLGVLFGGMPLPIVLR